jgi:cold shock protein
MARGTVKWFNPTKGYGFIQPQAGGWDGARTHHHSSGSARGSVVSAQSRQKVHSKLADPGVVAGHRARSVSNRLCAHGISRAEPYHCDVISLERCWRQETRTRPALRLQAVPATESARHEVDR